MNESLIQESQFTPMESLQKSTSKQFNLQDDEDSEKDVERQSESRNVSRNENCVQNTEKETEIAIVQPFEVCFPLSSFNHRLQLLLFNS